MYILKKPDSRPHSCHVAKVLQITCFLCSTQTKNMCIVRLNVDERKKGQKEVGEHVSLMPEHDFSKSPILPHYCLQRDHLNYLCSTPDASSQYKYDY